MSNDQDTATKPTILRGEKLVKYLRRRPRSGSPRRLAQNPRRRSRLRSPAPAVAARARCLHLLGGLDRPTEGEVYFRDRPLAKLDIDDFRAHQVGFVFQTFYLMPTLTALENVQIPMFEGKLTPVERIERATRLMDEVGLADGRTTTPTSSRSASASASRSPAHLLTSRACSWPTNRLATSIARARTKSSSYFIACATSASSRS